MSGTKTSGFWQQRTPIGRHITRIIQAEVSEYVRCRAGVSRTTGQQQQKLHQNTSFPWPKANHVGPGPAAGAPQVHQHTHAGPQWPLLPAARPGQDHRGQSGHQIHASRCGACCFILDATGRIAVVVPVCCSGSAAAPCCAALSAAGLGCCPTLDSSGGRTAHTASLSCSPPLTRPVAVTFCRLG